MSLLMMALTTLQKNDGLVPICSLPIRTRECGDNYSCHYRPDTKEILKNLGLKGNIEESFTIPQKWFCNEFILFTLRRIEEESKKHINALDLYLEKPNNTPQKQEEKRNIKEEIKHSEENIKENIINKSIKDTFGYIENLGMSCYYTTVKQYIKNEQKCIRLLACYNEENNAFMPDKSIKAIFDILFYENGIIEILDTLITTEDTKSFNKIVEFEK